MTVATALDAQPDAAGATWHRLSPRMLLVHPVVEIIRALPALVGVFLAGSTQGNHYWGLIGAGVVAALSLSRWFTTRLRITTDQVQLRQGLLRRKTITTNRERIRTVDVTSHLLHRVLGLARVVIGTGTSDRKGRDRLILDGLTLTAASTLRDDLLHRADPHAAVSRIELSRTPLREIARLDRAWIRYAPFTLSGVVTGLIIYGFLWRIQGESGVDLLHSGPLRSVTRALDAMPMAVAVLVLVVAAIVFVAITSTVGYVLAFWNFRLMRHDGGTVQVTRGLLTTRATSIERQRLVGVEVSEALLLRAVGGARAIAIATGLRVGRGAERGGEVLLPPAPRAEAEGVAALVLDGTPAITAPLRAHGRNAFRRRMMRALVGGATLLLITGVAYAGGAPLWVLVVGLVLMAASVPLAVDRYRSLGHAFVDGYLVTRFGSLVRRRSTVAADAVIGWNIGSTFFQRRLGLTTLTATTAAGKQGYRVSDIEPHEALALADTVVPDLLTPFRRTPDPAHPATSR